MLGPPLGDTLERHPAIHWDMADTLRRSVRRPRPNRYPDRLLVSVAPGVLDRLKAQLRDRQTVPALVRELIDHHLAVCERLDAKIDRERRRRAEVNVAAVLERVRDHLTGPERWTAGEEARQVDGLRVAPRSRQARSWSLEGALRAVADRPAVEVVSEFLRQELESRGEPNQSVDTFNDAPGRTQAKILEFVDACIAVARRELKAPVVGGSL